MIAKMNFSIMLKAFAEQALRRKFGLRSLKFKNLEM